MQAFGVDKVRKDCRLLIRKGVLDVVEFDIRRIVRTDSSEWLFARTHQYVQHQKN